MVNDINWEISLPSLSNKSTQEIIDVINHILSSDFKEIDVWLNKQVENNNLKSFKRELAHNVNFNQRDLISILDLHFNKRYFKTLNLMEYNNKTFRWEEIKYDNQFFLRKFVYTLKIPSNSKFYNFHEEHFKISVPEPWFVNIEKLDIKQLKTQKNIIMYLTIGFKFDKKITGDEFYPNVDCNHDFRLLYNGNWNWHLIWECKKCGFICFCSCFKDVIEACKQGKIITENKFKTYLGEEKTMKITQRIREDENWILKERGFIK